MSHRTRSILLTALAAGIFVTLAVWLYVRATGSKAYINAEGEAVPELPLSQIGGFAEPKYRETVDRYLDNLAYYRDLDAIPLPEIVGEGDDGVLVNRVEAARGAGRAPRASRRSDGVLVNRVEAALRREFEERDPENRPAGVDMGGEALEALATRVELILRRLSGMPVDAYMASMDDAGLRPTFAGDRGLLRYVADTFLDGLEIPEGTIAPEETGRIFRELYEVGQSYRDGTSRITAVSLEPGGFVAAVRRVPDELPFADVLSPALSERERALFYGSLAQQSPVIYTPASDQGIVETPRAHMAMIVETEGGDRYPITLQLKYDARSRAWHLTQASRQVSVRMATTPHLVY